jgi:hypothetical protein
MQSQNLFFLPAIVIYQCSFQSVCMLEKNCKPSYLSKGRNCTSAGAMYVLTFSKHTTRHVLGGGKALSLIISEPDESSFIKLLDSAFTITNKWFIANVVLSIISGSGKVMKFILQHQNC